MMMAMSLHQQGLDFNKLKKSFEQNQVIEDQMKRLRENRAKNSDQIIDDIYKREYIKFEHEF